jgi:hypothetical protein
MRVVRIGQIAPHAREVFDGQAELGQNSFVRDALATVEGGARGGDLPSFLLRNRLIVLGSGGETSDHRIRHHFEQMNHGRNLAGSQALDQFVGVFFRLRRGHHLPSLDIIVRRGEACQSMRRYGMTSDEIEDEVVTTHVQSFVATTRPGSVELTGNPRWN